MKRCVGAMSAGPFSWGRWGGGGGGGAAGAKLSATQPLTSMLLGFVAVKTWSLCSCRLNACEQRSSGEEARSAKVRVGCRACDADQRRGASDTRVRLIVSEGAHFTSVRPYVHTAAIHEAAANAYTRMNTWCSLRTMRSLG
jgi:hypothetical protein